MSKELEDGLHDFSDEPCFDKFYVTATAVGTCPRCNARNYADLGDMSDQTAPDVEAVKCWSCKEVSWLNSDMRSEATCMGYESIDDVYDVDGTEHP